MVAWSRGPRGRLVLPGVAAVLLLGSAGTAGAYVVPNLAGPPAQPAAEVTPTDLAPPPADGPGTAPGAAPGAGAPEVSTGPQPSAPVPGGRPADALAGWATQVAAKVGIPVTAVQAYGYAEVVVARTLPNCRLSWTTLAAIGKVESAHGSANQATLAADGQVLPPIRGLPLDGQGGRQLIVDTDRGAQDGDQTFDRAMGPMQFIPTTWKLHAVDADANGVTDPNDIDDAALAAANYLCQGGRNMSTSEAWWAAILSYNDVQRYAQDVFNAANDYGVRSRT
jgi:hypothetical protein